MARKATEKFRGSRTYGRGKKAGRGAGMRGGKGNAGLHKHKYITTVKHFPDYFGRPSMKRPPCLQTHKTVINLGKIQEFLPRFVAEGMAEKKGDMIEINLSEQGIDKLLGAGSIQASVRIIVDEATERAIAKVEKAGGEVVSGDVGIGKDGNTEPETDE